MARGEEMVAQDWTPRLDTSGGPDACWEWQGSRLPKGYGQVWLRRGGRRSWLAHRIAWVEHHGPIPDGLIVCHHCDNPPCCNPTHLFLGTYTDNVRDMMAKGRMGKTGPKPKSHCSRCGTEYARRTATGKAVCEPCEKVANKRKWQRILERRRDAQLV